MEDQPSGRYTNRSPSRRGPKPIPIDPRDVEALAESCVTKTHLAEELGISHDTLTNRLRDDEQFREAYLAGQRKLRRHVAGLVLQHAEKNAIAAITLANQPHILGFQNPNQRVEGRVEHVHTLSPAMLTFAKRREIKQLNGKAKGFDPIVADVPQPDRIDVPASPTEGDGNQEK